MKRLIITLTFFFCILPYICGSGKEREYCSESIKIDVLPGWALGNFVRPNGMNPVINPYPKLIFHCPMKLLYNGKNRTDIKRDAHYNPGTYSAGQVLFDLKNHFKAIKRLGKPFFYPIESCERNGQYIDGTVFIEGLTFFKTKWYLYYGCADSKVGVAVYGPAN